MRKVDALSTSSSSAASVNVITTTSSSATAATTTSLHSQIADANVQIAKQHSVITALAVIFTLLAVGVLAFIGFRRYKSIKAKRSAAEKEDLNNRPSTTDTGATSTWPPAPKGPRNDLSMSPGPHNWIE
jgi:hypothetical protein